MATPIDALPGISPGRQPYGPAGSGRHVPMVPHVLIVGDRRKTFVPPPLTRAATVYDTPTTVRVTLPDGSQETKQQHHVYCVPDDAAWQAVEAAHAALAQRLTDLATALRELGRYDKRLAAAGGLTAAANPLTPTVIGAGDPDEYPRWFNLAWHVPQVERKRITRHTAKMLFYRYGEASEAESSSAQSGYFLCPDDAAWERVQARRAAVEAATTAVTDLLRRLGTYEEAIEDGRYLPQIAPTPAPEQAPPPVAEHQALALVDDTVVEGILVMTVEEARAAADAIRGAVEDLRTKIDQFDQGRGWQVLGYDSFRAWAAAEIPDTSIRHVYRLRDANAVDRSLGLPAGSTPEAHARELKRVEPEQRADVLRAADQRAAEQGRERTAADVRAVTNGHTAPGLPADRLPRDWDAWRARVVALGGELTLSAGGVATMRLNGEVYAERPLAQWAGLTSSITIAEAAAQRRAELADTAPPAWQRSLAEAEQRIAWAAVRVQDPLTPDKLDAARMLLHDVPDAAARPLIRRIVDLGVAVAAAAGGPAVTPSPMGDGWSLHGPDGGELYRGGQLGQLLRRLRHLAQRPASPPAPDAPDDGDDGVPDTEGWTYGHDVAGEAVVAIDAGPLAPAVADGITAVAATLRALALGEAVDTAALDGLIAGLGECLERPGVATLIAVLEEVASDADALAGRREG